jgi:hypothetical protein
MLICLVIDALSIVRHWPPPITFYSTYGIPLVILAVFYLDHRNVPRQGWSTKRTYMTEELENLGSCVTIAWATLLYISIEDLRLLTTLHRYL